MKGNKTNQNQLLSMLVQIKRYESTCLSHWQNDAPRKNLRQALSALLVGIGSAYLFGPPTAEELLLVMEPQDTYWLALQIWKDRSGPGELDTWLVKLRSYFLYDYFYK